MPKLTPNNRLALLMHDHAESGNGKMGYGLLRYGVAPVVCVIDRATAGGDLEAITGIPRAKGIPIVATVEEALRFRPDVLIPAIAPPGGVLPADWMADVREGVGHGMSLLNGLHAPLADHPDLAPLVTRPGQWIWDVRLEPPGLPNGTGRARELSAKRVLFVGTDMANGKMTAALEMHYAAEKAGLRSGFVATGQIGIAIAGDGIPLDGVRVDFASGAVEKWVLEKGENADVVWVEGQGSLLNPASTATLPLLRGSMPTHLILVHRAGQAAIRRTPWVPIPPLSDVVRLYETVASAGGALQPAAKVAGIALNTATLSDADARKAVADAERETGLPVTDVIRFGVRPLMAGCGLT